MPLHKDLTGADLHEPKPHHVSHESGGSDEMDVTGLAGLLADPQTPDTHTHAEADITGLVADLAAKAPLASPTFTGTPTVPDDAYDATAWNGNAGIPTKNAIRDKIESLGGGGDALTTDGLDQFAATTSAELASVLSDETGTGLAVFNDGPTLVNPVVGTQSAGDNSTKAASTAFVKAAIDKQPEVLERAISDETTALTTGTAKLTFRMPFAMTLTDVRANVNTAPTGASILIDINEAGASIFSTRVSIAASSKTSVGGTPAVISDASLADDAEITVDIDQVGSTIAGKGLKIVLIGTRA